MFAYVHTWYYYCTRTGYMSNVNHTEVPYWHRVMDAIDNAKNKTKKVVHKLQEKVNHWHFMHDGMVTYTYSVGGRERKKRGCVPGDHR